MEENYKIEKVEPKDSEEVMEFLFKDFFIYAPFQQVIKVSDELHREVFGGLVERLAASGHSYVIRDERSEIIALRGCVPRSRDEPQYVKVDPANDKRHPFFEYGRKGALSFRLWEYMPVTVNKLMWITLLSVKKEYTRKGDIPGLAAKLVMHNLDQMEADGYEALAAQAGALSSQIVFSKLNFVKLAENFNKDILYEDGTQILQCIDGTEGNQLVALYL